MSERELKLGLEDRIPDMVAILSKGKDVEIRTVRDGIAISEINRKRIDKKEN